MLLLKKTIFFFFLFHTYGTIVYAQKILPEEYIKAYKNIAICEMHSSHIPASITLAQGLLESANGNSRLAVQANNHFGIKCHKGWDGEKIFHDDDAKDECFRKYKSAKESYKDHSEFLTTRPRYAFLFDIDAKNYKHWAQGLKKAGYATNPIYAEKLIKIIERYNLYKYDDSICEKKTLPNKFLSQENKTKNKKQEKEENFEINFWNNTDRNIFRNNGVKCIILKRKDNLNKIAKDFELELNLLEKYNELKTNCHLTYGQFVYLQPKKKKSKKEFHIVKNGETMHSISQKYAIKLKHLYKKNLMAEGTEPVLGQKLWLNKKKF